MLVCIYRSSRGAGLVLGFLIFSRGHAKISTDLEAYGDGLFLSPAGSIMAQVGCYKIAQLLNNKCRVLD